MNLTKVQPGHSLAERLRGSLRAKYGRSGIPDTTALLLDISGSMSGSPIVKLRELASEFTDTRRFEFSSQCCEIDRADGVSDPNGGTAMHVAFTHVKLHGIEHIVLITDGGPDDPSRALVAAHGLKVDALYVGPDPEPQFLRDLCGKTGGSYGKGSLDRVKELTASVRAKLMISAPGAIAL